MSIVASFGQPLASPDGGALLLKLVDDQLGLTTQVARALRDRRQPGKIAHPLRDLVRQRVVGLAWGYPDCNDAARLPDAPVHKVLLNRDPVPGPARVLQPTLGRFAAPVRRSGFYSFVPAVGSH